LRNLAKARDQQIGELQQLSTSRRDFLQKELSRQQQINDTACTQFTQAVNSFSGHVDQKLTSLNSSNNAQLEQQLQQVKDVIANVSQAEGLLTNVQKADSTVVGRRITVDPSKYTNVTLSDCTAQLSQFRLTLTKKHELLQTEVANTKKGGLTDDQLTEVDKNYAYFDATTVGYLEKRNLRACLQSLGEEATPAEVNNIMTKYGNDKTGRINKDQFVQLMITLLGDTNTVDEILQGFRFIATVNDATTIRMDRLEILVNGSTLQDRHVTYLKQNMQAKATDYDFVNWTQSVFAR